MSLFVSLKHNSQIATFGGLVDVLGLIAFCSFSTLSIYYGRGL